MSTRRTATRPDLADPNDDPRLLGYLRSVNDWHGYMRFLGLPHLHENPDEPLSRLFVEPYVHDAYHRPDEPFETWEKGRHRLIDLFDAKNSRVVLLGDPGAGKSTLLNWAAWNFTRWDGGEWLDKFGPLVPIPFVIRELAITRDITWDSLCNKFLEHGVAKGKLTRAELDAVFARGQAFVLVDGLDELSDLEARKALRTAIAEGMATATHTTGGRSAPWLLTSRIIGYEEVSYDSPDTPENADEADNPPREGGMSGLIPKGRFTFEGLVSRPTWSYSLPIRRAYCCPFDDRQVDQFARTWFVARETKGAAEGTRQATEFLSRLRSEGAPRALARIPNLLTLFALVYKVLADIPHGRAKLYDKVAEAYLESIDKSRGMRPRFTRDRMERWLAFVAFHLQTRRAAAAAKEEGRAVREILIDQAELLRLWVEEMSKVGGAPTATEVEEFLEFAARRSGLLLPRGEGLFAFMHLSFQEFFAARFLEDRIASPRWVRGQDLYPGTTRDDLNHYADSEVWTETMVLLFERLSEKPQWAEELREALFGPRYELRPDKARVSPARVKLLAEVLIDPHTGLERSERERDLPAFITWVLREQQKKRFSYGEALPTILQRSGFDHENRPRVFWECARNLSDLRKLDLSGCVAVTDLSPLARLTELRSLDLSGSEVADLSPLAALTNLTTLYLWDTEVTDAGVKELARLTNLTTLYLRGTGVTDAGVKELARLTNLTNLTNLHLNNTKVTGAGMKELVTLHNLTKLNLRGTPVTDAGLKELARLTNLTTLNLNKTKVTDAGVKELVTLHSLTNLYLGGTGVTDAGLKELARLTNLTTLYLWDTEVTDAGVKELARLTNLTTLYLRGTGVTDAGVKELARLTNLTNLTNLHLNNTKVTGAGMKELVTLHNLTKLNLRGTPVTDAGVLELAALHNLTTLNLRGTQVTDAAKQALKVALPKLQIDG